MWDPVLKMRERQRGPYVGVMKWKVRGSWVPWRVEAVSWMIPWL